MNVPGSGWQVITAPRGLWALICPDKEILSRAERQTAAERVPVIAIATGFPPLGGNSFRDTRNVKTWYLVAGQQRAPDEDDAEVWRPRWVAADYVIELYFEHN